MALSETSRFAYSGNKFFSRGLFRSVYVLMATALLCAVIVGSSVFLHANWNRLSAGMKDILFLGLFLFSVRCLISAAVLHKRVRTAYFGNELQNIPPYTTADIALDAAARAIVEDLVFTSLTAGILLFVSVTLLNTSK